MKEIIRSLDEEFRRLDERSRALVELIPTDKLYWQPRAVRFFPVYSCGENILRSAAAVEQTFGGLNANLWDDPFEWTLPETLSTHERVLEYLSEVEETRRSAFDRFASDADLCKEIAVPSSERQMLFALLAATLTRAAHHQGRAYAVFRLFSDERLPPV